MIFFYGVVVILFRCLENEKLKVFNENKKTLFVYNFKGLENWDRIYLRSALSPLKASLRLHTVVVPHVTQSCSPSFPLTAGLHIVVIPHIASHVVKCLLSRQD